MLLPGESSQQGDDFLCKGDPSHQSQPHRGAHSGQPQVPASEYLKTTGYKRESKVDVEETCQGPKCIKPL